MPEKDFDGVIAGGLYLQEEPKKIYKEISNMSFLGRLLSYLKHN